MVDIGRQRPAHLGDPALRDAPRDFHLPEAKMGVDDPQRYRQIVVAGRFDERHLIVVPVDRHHALEGRAFGGYGFEARRHVFARRQRRQHRAAGQYRAHDGAGDQSYPAGDHVGFTVLLVSGYGRNRHDE